MVRRVIPDASVIAKWYLLEEDREQALKLRNDYLNGLIQISVPSILHFEVLNALRYSSKEISEEQLCGIARSLSLYGFETYDLSDEEYASEVTRLSLRKGISVYDSSYVALAKILNAHLYTADEKLLEKLDEEKSFCHHISGY